MEAWWEVGSAGRMEAWWEVGSAGRMEAWWEIGFAGRMAPEAPGGVADWCCGCEIRRSAEAPKRRSASIAGLPLETIYLGASTCNSPRIAWLPPVAMASVVGRMGSRAWGHGWEIGSAGRMAPEAPGKGTTTTQHPNRGSRAHCSLARPSAGWQRYSVPLHEDPPHASVHDRETLVARVSRPALVIPAPCRYAPPRRDPLPLESASECGRASPQRPGYHRVAAQSRCRSSGRRVWHS